MLINSLAEVRAVLPVGAGNDFLRLRPHMLGAETGFILPILGRNMHEELQEFCDEMPPEPLTAVQLSMRELLEKVRYAIVHLGYFLGFDFLNVSVSDMGFQRLESERSKPLYKYQEDNLRDYYRTAGFNALDEILLFMEEREEHFAEWKLSPQWTVFRQMLIPTAREFDRMVHIGGSRLTFLRLRPHMSHVETTRILPLLGREIYAEIKTSLLLAEPAAKVVAILEPIRQAVAFLSSALLMEESGADLSERGLYFYSTMQNFFDNRKSGPADAERIALLVARNRQIGKNFLLQVRQILLDNPLDWPGAAVPLEGQFRRDNTGKKTFWA